MQVVRDEENRHAQLPVEPPQQLENLRLNRHVERRCRLVGEQELRLRQDGRGDADALQHAAG